MNDQVNSHSDFYSKFSSRPETLLKSFIASNAFVKDSVSLTILYSATA